MHKCHNSSITCQVNSNVNLQRILSPDLVTLAMLAMIVGADDGSAIFLSPLKIVCETTKPNNLVPGYPGLPIANMIFYSALHPAKWRQSEKRKTTTSLMVTQIFTYMNLPTVQNHLFKI